MPRDLQRYAHDVIRACDAIAECVQSTTREEYLATRKLRSSLERELFVIGEAVSHLRKNDAKVESYISDSLAIVKLRNLLAHEYWVVQHELIWSIAHNDIPDLRSEMQTLLRALEHGDE